MANYNDPVVRKKVFDAFQAMVKELSQQPEAHLVIVYGDKINKYMKELIDHYIENTKRPQIHYEENVVKFEEAYVKILGQIEGGTLTLPVKKDAESVAVVKNTEGKACLWFNLAGKSLSAAGAIKDTLKTQVTGVLEVLKRNGADIKLPDWLPGAKSRLVTFYPDKQDVDPVSKEKDIRIVNLIDDSGSMNGQLPWIQTVVKAYMRYAHVLGTSFISSRGRMVTGDDQYEVVNSARAEGMTPGDEWIESSLKWVIANAEKRHAQGDVQPVVVQVFSDLDFNVAVKKGYFQDLLPQLEKWNISIAVITTKGKYLGMINRLGLETFGNPEKNLTTKEGFDSWNVLAAATSDGTSRLFGFGNTKAEAAVAKINDLLSYQQRLKRYSELGGVVKVVTEFHDSKKAPVTEYFRVESSDRGKELGMGPLAPEDLVVIGRAPSAEDYVWNPTEPFKASKPNGREKKRNRANLANNEATVDSAANTGGIDLNTDKLDLNVKSDGSVAVKAMDPAMIAQFKDAPGLVPVIIGIRPVTDLPAFLGLSS